VFSKVNGVWQETQKIMSPNPQMGDSFGIGVSISGDQMLIGSQGVNSSRGAAYLYVNNNGVWEYEETITASNAAPDNYFGSSVTIEDSKAVVGAYGVNAEVGAAYVFEKNSQGSFEEVQILNANPSSDRVQFGWATAINQDYIAVTAPHIYGIEMPEVYFYKKDGSGTWVEDQIIVGDDTVEEDFLGWSVALNGQEMIIGAPREDHDVNGNNEMGDAGSAYIFKNPNILGVTDFNAENSFKIYPNPATTVFSLTSTKSVNTIKIYSVTGSLIKNIEVNNNTTIINIDHLLSGIYLVDISFEDGTQSVQKLVKQ
tara:strand:- start:284 stop:1222 length:939 start_codon:yes stop_codon:yes gene_type:complete